MPTDEVRAAEQQADREQAIANAAIGLSAIDPYAWEEIGLHLTCSEVEPLLHLLETLGWEDSAEALLDGHAAADEDDTDEHHDRYLQMQAVRR